MNKMDHFNLLAAVYDKLISPPDLTTLQSLLKLPAAGWMLDAGGGTGRVSAGLRSLLDGVIVCDSSAPMLQKTNGKGNLLPIKGDVGQLPFADNSFERILVVDALHHFKAPEAAITEFYRILKPGGRIVIEEFNIRRLSMKLIAWTEKLALMGSHFFPLSEISEMLRARGFSSRIENENGATAWVTGDK